MAENNTSAELDIDFTFSQHSVEHKLNVLKSAGRALAVIAMQDVDDEPTDAAPIPPIEIITVAQDAEDLRGLADLFTILAGATEQAADQLDAQTQEG